MSKKSKLPPYEYSDEYDENDTINIESIPIEQKKTKFDMTQSQRIKSPRILKDSNQNSINLEATQMVKKSSLISKKLHESKLDIFKDSPQKMIYKPKSPLSCLEVPDFHLSNEEEFNFEWEFLENEPPFDITERYSTLKERFTFKKMCPSLHD